MKVKFKADYCGHEKGKVINLESQLAGSLIKEGVCEVVTDEAKPKTVEAIEVKEVSKPIKKK